MSLHHLSFFDLTLNTQQCELTRTGEQDAVSPPPRRCSEHCSCAGSRLPQAAGRGWSGAAVRPGYKSGETEVSSTRHLDGARATAAAAAACILLASSSTKCPHKDSTHWCPPSGDPHPGQRTEAATTTTTSPACWSCI